MKRIMKKVMMIMVLGAVMACLVPAHAQTMQFQSTSTMRGTGSSYTPPVTTVGAVSAVSEATTTESYSPAKAPNGPRRVFDLGGDTKPSDQSPIGDAVLPLLLMAAVYGVVCIVYRRKRRA